MVSHYTTLVPSLGLHTGPACEAGLGAGMRRECVPPHRNREERRPLDFNGLTLATISYVAFKVCQQYAIIIIMTTTTELLIESGCIRLACAQLGVRNYHNETPIHDVDCSWCHVLSIAVMTSQRCNREDLMRKVIVRFCGVLMGINVHCNSANWT